MEWAPWLQLMPRIPTSASSAAAPTRSLVPGTAKLQKAEFALSTAKRFIVSAARDGARAAADPRSLHGVQCVLQVLEAEKQALLLLLTRQRPSTRAPLLPAAPIGGNEAQRDLVKRRSP